MGMGSSDIAILIGAQIVITLLALSVFVALRKRDQDAARAREAQEDRIDGAAVVAADRRPHEEELHNDLLADKEQMMTPIVNDAPVIADAEPTLGQPAPDDIKAEVQAAIAAATEASESVKQTVDEAAAKSSTEGDPPAAPQS